MPADKKIVVGVRLQNRRDFLDFFLFAVHQFRTVRLELNVLHADGQSFFRFCDADVFQPQFFHLLLHFFEHFFGGSAGKFGDFLMGRAGKVKLVSHRGLYDNPELLVAVVNLAFFVVPPDYAVRVAHGRSRIVPQFPCILRHGAFVVQIVFRAEHLKCLFGVGRIRAFPCLIAQIFVTCHERHFERLFHIERAA